MPQRLAIPLPEAVESEKGCLGSSAQAMLAKQRRRGGKRPSALRLRRIVDTGHAPAKLARRIDLPLVNKRFGAVH